MHYLLKRYCKETRHMVHIYDKMSVYEREVMKSRGWREVEGNALK